MHKRRYLAALAILAVTTAGMGMNPIPSHAEETQDSLANINDFHSDARYQKYYHQQLTWRPDCIKAKEKVFECAKVLAPADWYHPEKGDTNVIISRIVVDGKPIINSRLLLTNPGGPGAPGLTLSAQVMEMLSLEKTHTPIDIQPRGTGWDEPYCDYKPEPGTAASDGDSRFPSRAESRARTKMDSEAALACIKTHGDRIANINTDQISRDFNLVRAVMGFEQADYVGFSYGTMLGSYIKKSFPQSFDRVVLDANMNVFGTYDQAWYDMAVGFQHAIDRGLWPWLARQHATYGFGETAFDVAKFYEYIRAQVKAGKGGFFTPDMLDNFMVQIGGTADLYQIAGGILTSLKAVIDGKEPPPGTMGAETDPKAFLARLAAQYDEDSGAALDVGHVAVVCNDLGSTTNDEMVHGMLENLYRVMPIGAGLGSGSKCSRWPFKPTLKKEILNRPMKALMTQNEMDPNTPYWGALRAYRNTTGGSRMLFVDNAIGHGAALQACGRAVQRDYIRDGYFPKSDTFCQAEPLPDETVTYEYAKTATDDRPLPFEGPYVLRDLNMPKPVATSQPKLQEKLKPELFEALYKATTGRTMPTMKR